MAIATIFGIDGSIAPIENPIPPLYKKIAFIKTALLKLDGNRISKIDKDSPHPLEIKDMLTDTASYHATVLPLRHVSIQGMNTYNTIRRIIFDSIKDTSQGECIMDTLKWIAYEKWSKQKKDLPLFECPHCEKTVATLQYDKEEGYCPNPDCQSKIYLTDMLGFHQL